MGSQTTATQSSLATTLVTVAGHCVCQRNLFLLFLIFFFTVSISYANFRTVHPAVRIDDDFAFDIDNDSDDDDDDDDDWAYREKG